MRLKRIYVALGALALVAIVRFACKSESSVPTPSTSVDIDFSGGALSFVGGGSLDVPPGALSAKTTISVEPIDAPTSTAFSVVGPFYRFKPEGQTFDAAVTVRLPLPGFAGSDAGIDRIALLTVVWTDGGAWERIPSWVDPETWSVVTFVRGFSSGGAVLWGSDACATSAGCPGGGAAFCVMGNLVQSVCGTSQKCTTTVVENCVANGKHCVEGACVGGQACASNTDCEASGARYCEGTTVVQAMCVDGRCVEFPQTSCETLTPPRTCASGACVAATACLSDSTCVDGGAAFCGGEEDVWRWQCVGGACLPRIVDACWHAGNVCVAGTCATGAACTQNSGCPDGGGRFCDDGDVVAWRCSPQSDKTSRCQRWVQENCELRGMRCLTGVCAAVDAGAVADGGGSGDAGAFCGCEADGGANAKPDGGDLVVVDGGCLDWSDATYCSGWHSVIGDDAGVNPFGLFPSGTQYTYFDQSCTLEIRCY